MNCHRYTQTKTQRRGYRPWGGVMVAVCVLLLVSPVFAGSVRTYDSAVVTSDQVRLGDVASLSNFPPSLGDDLAEYVIANAPHPGETSVIFLQKIREVLRSQGVNFAQLTFHGATRCQVSRVIIDSSIKTSVMPPSRNVWSSTLAPVNVRANKAIDLAAHAEFVSSNSDGTLRQAVVGFFQKELAPYPGIVEVSFDRDSEQMLGLSGPNYQFRISRSSKTIIGLTSVRVDVVADSRLIQTIPMAINVTLTRSLLSTKRAINAKATIRPTDVEIVPIVVTELDQDVLLEASLAVGLRANRFIPSGILMKPAMLESVPLVMRGQLVRLTSVSGSVSVVTAAKASESGRIGEVITVRSVDNKRVEFPATVVGPGRVQIGGKLPHVRGIAQAGGGRS